MDMTSLMEQREAKNRFFANDHHSPLLEQDRRSFGGLAYYEPNPDLSFTLVPDPSDGAAIHVQTSDGQTREYRRVARVSFELDGQTADLTLYSTGQEGYFVPFRDKTSGTETYGAGRYLDVDPNDDGTVSIDFNYAYNPYCAYNQAYSCPLPPMENWLQVPIEAGEKDFRPAS